MEIFFSWGTTFLILLCCLKYPFRVLVKKFDTNQISLIFKLDHFLHYSHKFMGFLCILFTFIHCSISERSSNQSSTLGAFLLMIQILLALSYGLRKALKNKWIIVHRILTAILLGGLAIHVFLEFNFLDGGLL